MRLQKTILLVAILGLLAVPAAAFADFCVEQWETVTAMPQINYIAAAAVYDGKFYVFGGHVADPVSDYDTTLIYDFETDAWTTGAVMPDAIYDQNAAAYGGLIYTVGGVSDNSSFFYDYFWQYDVAGNSWTALTDYSATVYTPGVAAGNGRFYVLGDFSGLATPQYWDISGGTWNDASGLYSVFTGVFPSMAPAGVLTYVYCGWGGQVFGVFDTVTGAWTPLANTPDIRNNPALVRVQNRVFLIGGGGLGGSQVEPFQDAKVYDIALNTWSDSAIGVPYPQVWGAMFGYSDEPWNVIVLAGGRDNGAPRVTVATTAIFHTCKPYLETAAPNPVAPGGTITIEGENFPSAVTVFLTGADKTDYPLENITPVDEETITATIPAAQAEGTYDLTVQASGDNESDTLADALVVAGGDDDTVIDDDVVDDDAADDDAADDDAADDDTYDDDLADDDDNDDDNDNNDNDDDNDAGGGDDDDDGCGC